MWKGWKFGDLATFQAILAKFSLHTQSTETGLPVKILTMAYLVPDSWLLHIKWYFADFKTCPVDFFALHKPNVWGSWVFARHYSQEPLLGNWHIRFTKEAKVEIFENVHWWTWRNTKWVWKRKMTRKAAIKQLSLLSWMDNLTSSCQTSSQ